MNSYNENLQSAVVSSLLSQQLEQKKIEAELNASTFTLYHAQGAVVKENEKLEVDKRDEHQKLAIYCAAIDNSNLCTNLQSSAAQAVQYIKQSVTNTSVAAANVQVAANAIVKLAGDMGNAFSIVNAADYDSEIYNQAENARTLMNKTAYVAELTSQKAMEATMLTSEVISPAVLDKSKNTNGEMTNLLKITAADFATAADTVKADKDNVNKARVVENSAAGDYEDIMVDNRSTNKAYNSLNAKLNLNLKVNDLSSGGFNVSFDLIKLPFPGDPTLLNVEQAWLKQNKPVPGQAIPFPVQNYYIIVVKQSEQYIFTTTDAENIVLNYPQQCVQVSAGNISVKPVIMPPHVGPGPVIPPASIGKSKNSKVKPSKQKNPLAEQNTVSYVANCPVTLYYIPQSDQNPTAGQGTSSGNTVPSTTAKKSTIPPSTTTAPDTSLTPPFIPRKDSDNDDIVLGTDYVVFVYAQYLEVYKKLINNFDDFLSAPSLPFCLTNTLSAATGIKWVQSGPVQTDIAASAVTTVTTASPSSVTTATTTDPSDDDTLYTFTFTVNENPDFDVDYRLMLLPNDPGIIGNLHSSHTMKTIKDEVKVLESIADYYDPKIAKQQAKLSQLIVSQQQVQAELDAANAAPKTPTPTAAHTNPVDALKLQIATLTTSINNLNNSINDLINERDAEIQANEKPTVNNGLFFNVTIAEQVAPGNFILGVPPTTPPAPPSGPTTSATSVSNKTAAPTPGKSSPAGGSSSKNPPASGNSGSSTAPASPSGVTYTATIGREATDNFGNILISGNTYIPLVLSVCGITVDTPEQFTSSLSSTTDVSPAPFTFIDPLNPPLLLDPPPAPLSAAPATTAKNGTKNPPSKK